MLEMAITSVGRLVAGKMFADNRLMARQLAIGVGIGTAAVVGMGLMMPFWLAAVGGGAVAGFLQPLLFKNLKYT